MNGTTWIWTLMIARAHDSLLRWMAFDVYAVGSTL